MKYAINFVDSTEQTFPTPEEREACMDRLRANGLYLFEDYTLADIPDDTNRKENTMRLKDLKPIIYSKTGDIQFVIIYDFELNTDLEANCSFEYACEHYGDREVKRISAYKDDLVITV